MPSKDPMRRKIYTAWKNIKMRCYDPKIPGYKNYGARGIKMCDEWFNNFEAFYEWSLANGCEPGLTIDRIDNDGNYEPDNCRWVTQTVNANNRGDCVKLTHNGKTQTLAEWARELGMTHQAITDRYKSSNWSLEEMLTYKTHERPVRQSLFRIKVNQYDADMNFIKTFDSLTEACKEVGMFNSNLSRALECGGKCKGYYWKYADGYERIPKSRRTI